MKPIDIFNLSEEDHAKLAGILTEGLPNGDASQLHYLELESKELGGF